MKQAISSYINYAMTFLLLVIAACTPLLFLNSTTEFFEMPKLIFLVVSTLLLLGLWIFSWIIKSKVVITKTPLDIPLLVLLGVTIVSSYFSLSRTEAVYGNFPRIHGSAVSIVTYILLYFVTVSNLNTLPKIKNFLYALYGSGIVISLVSLMSFFGLYLPFDFARVVNFTPTGSSFSTIAFLLLLLPLPMLSLVNPNKYMPVAIAATISTLFGIVIVLTGSPATYVALFITLLLCVFVSKPHHVRKTMPLFILPIAAMALIFALAYLPLTGNKIQILEANFPKEIQLPFVISWKISASAFRDAPFLGTGPSSYLFDFGAYKPAEFNSQTFWSFSFDTAYNEFLQILGTLGVFGFLAFTSICLIILKMSRDNLTAEQQADDRADDTHVIVPGLAISGLLAIVLFAIHATTLVSLVATLFIFAAFMMSQRRIREKVMEFSMGIRASTSEGNQLDLFPIILFIIFLIAAIPALYKLYTVVAADHYHRLALSQASTSGTATYQDLQKAETLNPEIDLYRVDLAQTNFALANAIAASKGPSKTNPQGSLTDQDKQTIQTLLSQAINEGRVAVALSPLSARNWEVLASVYQNISGVAQNALAFSLDAYGHAIQLDPLNPALRVSVGGIYYAAKNYPLATRFFTDAANLKPDYANAYYNLAITLRDSGDLQNAKLVADQLVVLLKANTKSPDYQVATALDADLATKVASNNTGTQSQGGQATTPASQTNSALQNPNLPNVTTLSNPPQPTPVPSVKPNPQANIPQATPTPSK